MAKIIIFGMKDFTTLAHYYLDHDSKHEVVAFCVSKEYLPLEMCFEGLPVIAYENIQSEYPQSEFSFFAPLSHRNMNRARESIYLDIANKGYRFISYVSSRATVFPGTPIGGNCFILEDNTIQPFTAIGNNVILWSGNHIGHHSVIKDHVLFTSHVVLSGHCVVEPYCFFGVNASVRDGLHIAEGSFIAMGSNITEDTEPWGVYKGNPAKKHKLASKDLTI